MHLADVYAQSRKRMIELAATLTPEQQQTTVPATSRWTVADVYRHVAGVPADVLAGRVEGGGYREWTAAQVSGYPRRRVVLSFDRGIGGPRHARSGD